MAGVESVYICGPGRHNLGPGKYFQQNYRPGKQPEELSPGHLDRAFL